MRIIVIGGTGTIGSAVVKQLAARHEIISAGTTHGDIKVDITDNSSITKMYQQCGQLDAVICTAGKVHFAPLGRMTNDLYQIGLQNKLMGQINLVLLGLNHVNEGGSFTLTSGILNHDPIRTGSSAAMVNGALDSFVKSAALEMPKNLRINCVSPTIIAESMQKYEDFFRGFEPVTAARAALAYVKSIEGAQTGEVYRVGY